MRFLSLHDIEQGIKRRIYNFQNQSDGTALVWDSEKRKYIGHVELPKLQQEAEHAGIDLSEWVGFGQGGNWGSSGW